MSNSGGALPKCARRIQPSNNFPMYIRSIGIAGVILGLLFKTLHWPGGNIILLIGAALAAVTMTVLLIQTPGPWSIHIQQPAWLFGSVAVVLPGVVFKMMYWPGANILLLLGMMACAAWFLVPQPRTQATA